MDFFIDPKNNKRTQELENFYRLNGAIYILNWTYVGKIDKLYSEWDLHLHHR